MYPGQTASVGLPATGAIITLAGSQVDYLRPGSIAIGVTLVVIGVALAIWRRAQRSRGTEER